MTWPLKDSKGADAKFLQPFSASHSKRMLAKYVNARMIRLGTEALETIRFRLSRFAGVHPREGDAVSNHGLRERTDFHHSPPRHSL
jgi:hypothetical protein